MCVFAAHNDNCCKLKQAGFDSHPDVFVGCGFCDALFLRINNACALLKTMDLSDVASWNMVRQASSLAFKCPLTIAADVLELFACALPFVEGPLKGTKGFLLCITQICG